MTSFKEPGSRERLKELVALLVFLIVTVPISMPCLCPDGAIRGRVTSTFTFFVFCRLAWDVYRRKFNFRDYFVYLGIVIAFCIWAESRI
jgi:hypothetical protein